MQTKLTLLCLAGLLGTANAASLTPSYAIGGAPFNGTNLFVDQAVTGGGDFTATGNFAWAAVLTNQWNFGDAVSITGIALPIHTNSASGDITFHFYDIGADNDFTGVANERFVGSATASYDTANLTSANAVIFDTPVDFVAAGTGIVIRISTTASTQVKVNTVLNADVAVRDNSTTGVAIGGTNPGFRLTLAGTASPAPDADADGLPDAFETDTGTYVSITDTGTDPNDSDSDDDTLPDGAENNSGIFVSAANPGTNPNLADTDSDGLNDKVENGSGTWGSATETGTNPNDNDSDNDTLLDNVETNDGTYDSPSDTGTNPNLADSDNDGLSDGIENNRGTFVSKTDPGTNPNDDDTDNDTLKDGWEVAKGTDPYVADGTADPDTDGLDNIGEQTAGTNPFDADSDNDGLTDNREANPLAAGYTATNPLSRDHDGDGLNDKFEVDQGFNPLANADFDNDTFSDAKELLFYGSSPTDVASFPGDGTSPAAGSFTPILNAGTVANPGDLALGGTLVNAIINEGAQGGNDYDFPTGITNFTVVYQNALPAAGTQVNLTGFAWTVISAGNTNGDILLEFFDLGANGVFDGVDTDTKVGSARGTLTVPAATAVMYWNFAAPISFTSAGTGLAVRILSTGSLRIKAADNIATGQWNWNAGLGTIGNIRASRFSIGGTATYTAPKILTLTRSGTTNDLTWTLGNAPTVTLQRSTTLSEFTNVPGKINTTDTSYSETSTDPRAFFRLTTP